MMQVESCRAEQLSFQNKTVSKSHGRRRQRWRGAAQGGEKRQKKSSKQQQTLGGLDHRNIEAHC